MQHRTVLVLGTDTCDSLFRVMDLLTRADAGVALDPHIVILEGESDGRFKAFKPPCSTALLPDPKFDDRDAINRFRRVKRWVREHLGDSALEGYNIRALEPALERPETLKRLADYLRGEAAPADDVRFVEAHRSQQEWMKLCDDLVLAGCDRKQLELLPPNLHAHPKLGRLTHWDDTVYAYGVRLSEYLMYIRPEAQLLPLRWQKVDWLLLSVENRTAQDLLNRCLVPHDHILSPVSKLAAHACILLLWPNPWAEHPLSGHGWTEVAFARELTNLRKRLKTNTEFQGQFIHFSETSAVPARATQIAERPAEMADFLELLAYWQAENGSDWHGMVMPPEGGTPSPGKRSVILGMARAILEPPGRFSRLSRRGVPPLRLVAPMERGTEWKMDADGWQVTIGAWSLAPELWSSAVRPGAPAVTVQTRLFVGDGVRDPVGKVARLQWAAGSATEKLGSAPRDATLPQPIRVPYLNFVALMVVVIVDGDIPLSHPNQDAATGTSP